MAVKRSGNFLAQLRLDTTHMRAIESATRNDFDELLRALVTGQGVDQSYVLRGFKLNTAGAIGNSAKSLAVITSDSAILHGGSTTSGTFFITQPTEPVQTLDSIINSNVSGAFAPNTLNYISLDFVRQADTATSAPQAFWDSTNKVDFSKTVPLAETLKYRFIIQSGAFAPNTLPLYTVLTGPANDVISFSDDRPLLGRLGKAGLSGKNPTYSFSWAEGKAENPSTATNFGDNPFYGADKAIGSLKDWMDAVMTEIKAIKGSSFWYTDGSTSVPKVNLSDLYSDLAATVITGSGKFINSDTVIGELSWTTNLTLKNVLSKLEFNIPVDSIILNNNQTAYIELQRNLDFQPANSFTFTNNSVNVVGGALVTGLNVGDYIKADTAPLSAWAKVTAIAGINITLETPYSGSSYVGKAYKAVSSYIVQVNDPENIPTSSDIYWIAHRRDSLAPAATITTLVRSNDITTITTSAPHSFAVGEAITVDGAADSSFDGNFVVISTPSATQLTVMNDGPDDSSTDGTIEVRSRIYLRGLGEISAGEEQEIGDNTVLNMIQYLGMESETQSAPSYNAPLRNITQGQNITAAISSLDRELDKFFGQLQIKAKTPASQRVVITGADVTTLDTRAVSQEMISFLMNFDGAEINFQSGSIYASDGVTLIGSFTPATIASGQYRWYAIGMVPGAIGPDSRITPTILITAGATDGATPTLAPRAVLVGNKKLGQVVVQETGSGIANIQQSHIVQLGVGSGGSGAGTITADLYDPISVTLPAGPSYTGDGVNITNGMTVLFANLGAGNNRVYKVSGVGTSMVWTPEAVFAMGFDAQDGESVRIKQGNSFNEQLAVFNGTNFEVNNLIRMFDGVSGNFWELSSVKTLNIANNSTSNIFQVSLTGSENMIINYSVIRGSAKQTGQLMLTAIGANVKKSDHFSAIGDIGLDFNATISSGDLILSYTSDNSGATGILKYFVHRWSDSAGGPTGIPNYSTGGGGGSAAAGAINEVQYHGAGGILAAESRFKWNPTGGALELGGLQQVHMPTGTTILDNQVAPATILSYAAASYRHAIIEYSLSRNGEYRTGRLLVAAGATVAVNDDMVQTADLGIALSWGLNAGNVEIRYTSASTGNNGVFKASIRRWTS
jgi:hypothetical protein